MPFKSKAHKAKMAELVKSGKITQESFDEMNSKTDHHSLPERVEVKSSKPKSLLRKKHQRI